MKVTIIFWIFTAFFYYSIQALNCNVNPCDLGGYFAPDKGYECLQLQADALCTCPNGGYEMNQPCRVCNRVNPADNACIASSTLLACLETNDYGTAFACLCSGPSGPALTASANCDSTVTLTSTSASISSTLVPVTPPPCSNGGNFVDGICHCPSGYTGTFCEQKNDGQLCARIVCQNSGACAIRNPNGPYQSICLCRYGTTGDYCHLNGTLGFCTMGLCLNNAACREDVVELTRHAYCNCQPGYGGIRCENRYFQCFSVGKFTDTLMQDQGKYFECTLLNGSYRLAHKSCAKGLRFNSIKNTCTLY